MARTGLANKILIVIVLLLALAAVVGFILIGTQGDAIDAILESSSSGQQQIEDQKGSLSDMVDDVGNMGSGGEGTGESVMAESGPSILEQYEEREPDSSFMQFAETMETVCANCEPGTNSYSVMLSDDIEYVTMVDHHYVAKYADDTVAKIPVGRECHGVKICSEADPNQPINDRCVPSGAVASGQLNIETFHQYEAIGNSNSYASDTNLRVACSYDKLILDPMGDAESMQGAQESTETGVPGNKNLVEFARKVSEGCEQGMSEKTIQHTFETACRYIYIKGGKYRCAHHCPAPTSIPAGFGACDSVEIQDAPALQRGDVQLTVQYDGTSATIMAGNAGTSTDTGHGDTVCYPNHSPYEDPGDDIDTHGDGEHGYQGSLNSDEMSGDHDHDHTH